MEGFEKNFKDFRWLYTTTDFYLRIYEFNEFNEFKTTTILRIKKQSR